MLGHALLRGADCTARGLRRQPRGRAGSPREARPTCTGRRRERARLAGTIGSAGATAPAGSRAARPGRRRKWRPPLSTVQSTEDRVQSTARAIFAALAGEKPGRLSRERLQGDVMEWAMADERLKVEMLRFVDVFPTLRSREEIARHLREYFARQGIAAPAALRWGISLTGQRSPVAPLASAVIRRQMSSFAQRFIVGRDARSAVPALRTLRREGVGFTLDVLGEATVSEAEGLAYQRTYLDLLDRPRRRGGVVAGDRLHRPGGLGAAAARQPQPQDHVALLADRPRGLRRQRRPRQGPAAPDLPQRHPDRSGPHARPRAVPLPRPDARGVHVAARRGGVPRVPRRRPGASGLPARRRPGPRAPASPGRASAAARSTCVWSRAPTGTTRRSSPRRRAGRCRCSRTSRTPTPCTRS